MQLQEDVVKILKAVLNLKETSISFEPSAQLLGGLPEFDSTAVVTVLTAFEEAFDIEFDDEEISGEIFETVGSLTSFLEQKLNGSV